jgi:hypothetical protein
MVLLEVYQTKMPAGVHMPAFGKDQTLISPVFQMT